MFPRKNGTYYTRKRVPPKFRPVVKEKRVWISLRTKNAAEARLREPSVWAEQIADWEMRLAEHRPETPEERYTRISARAEREGHRYLTATELLDAKVDLILARTDALAADKHRDPEKIAALLGGVERPQLMLSDLVAYVENLKPMKQENRFKSQEQMHRWRQARERAVNNLRAAIKSKSGADDKPVIELTADDAWLHHDAWLVRLDTGEPEQDGGARKYVTADTGNTDLGYVSGLLRRFYASIKTKNPKPYAGIALKDPHSIPNRKLELPVKWMEQTIFDQEKMSGLNEEARSILIIAAEVGCRQSEIHDLPPESFRLDHPIPHLIIRNEAPEVLDDGTKVGGRQIKNIYSTRKIALVGHALEAARRHPQGFPRYRGKRTFSAAVNKFLRTNDLFPAPPDPDQKYTIGGARHSFESRMKSARLHSDDRGEMMGHSVKSDRNRELYGDEMPLEVRAMIAKLIAFGDAVSQAERDEARAELEGLGLFRQ